LGGTPFIIDKTHLDDKNWTVCVQHDDQPYLATATPSGIQAFGTGDVLMSVSSDGGLTWGAGLASSDIAGDWWRTSRAAQRDTSLCRFEGGGIDVSSTTVARAGARAKLSPASQATADAVASAIRIYAAISTVGRCMWVWSDCRFRSGCKKTT